MEEAKRIFVFGSNLAGRHGKGAAQYAMFHHGAIYGRGIGRQGNSYAIPTKDHYLNVLPRRVIWQHVLDFLDYAYVNHELDFEVTRIACGLAGYRDYQIAPMFKTAPDNCLLHLSWYEIIESF